MPTINLENLIRYDSKAKNEAEEEYLPKDSGNWQKTEKAGAVSFYPVENSPLEGTVDFMFSEVPPASGDKGPENPSTITGVSSVKVTRCGENLFNVYGQTVPTNANALPEADSDGYIEITGTPNSSVTSYRARCVEYSNAILDESFYTVVIEASNFTNCYLKFEVGSNVGSVRGQLNTGRVDVSATGVTCIACTNNNLYNANCILRLILCIPAGGQSYSARFRISVLNGNISPSAYSYEPYSGVDCIVSLGDTYYGGSIDLATGVMTVTWDAVKFTGNEPWELTSESNETSSIFQSNLGLPNMTMSSTQNASTRCCSHFPYSGGSSLPYRFMTWGNTTRIYFTGPASVFPDANSFKAFLASEYAAGHPVVLVYLKAAPQTVQLSPTSISSLAQTDKCMPRLNTVYTDAEAIQIGYMKSPQRTEQEIAQAILEIESDDSD